MRPRGGQAYGAQQRRRCGALFHRSMGGEHQFQHLVEAGVHVGLGNFAVLYGLHQLPDGVSAGTGHSEGGAVLHAEGVVIGAAPVGDDGSVEALVLPQNVLQQVGILVGVGAVDEVVAQRQIRPMVM